MTIHVTEQSLESIQAEALVVLHEEAGLLAETGNDSLKKHLEAFAREVEAKKTKREWFCTIGESAGCRTEHLLLDSETFCGPMPHDEPLKTTAARAVETCRAYSLKKLAFAVHHDLSEAKAAAIVEGILLGDFSDDRFKGSPDKREELEIILAVPPGKTESTRRAAERAEKVARAVNSARELVNAPHHVLTPAELAAHGKRLAEKYGMDVSILDEKELQENGYLPTWNVGRGSEYPPRMVIIRYRPAEIQVEEHIGLVGKGMTFDTGGYSLKVRGNMHEMNADMGGAAAVLGTMEAIGELRPPVRVTAVITSAHNAVDGAAYVPGCILKAKNGKTIYVENTDAEGRLILSDALHRAGEEGAKVIFDYATLTGAIGVALGPYIAGLFTDDEPIRNVFLEAGANTGDEMWPMPLVREYEPMLKHHLADVNNMAKIRQGGAIHAANFLKNFVPEGVRWAHIDLAGPAHSGSKWRYFAPGGSGFGVRLTVEALRLMAEEAP